MTKNFLYFHDTHITNHSYNLGRRHHIVFNNNYIPCSNLPPTYQDMPFHMCDMFEDSLFFFNDDSHFQMNFFISEWLTFLLASL